MIRLMLPEQYQTDRLVVARLRYEDAEEMFYAYASKPEATRFVTWLTHKSIDDTRSYLRYAITAWRNGTDYAFSVRIKETSRLIGSIGIVNNNGKLQVGYIYSPTQWGRGYASEVCQSMVKLLVQQPGVYRIQSFIDAENVASGQVLKKAGFVEEARLEQWLRFVNQDNLAKDCVHFRLPLEKFQKPETYQK